MVKSLTLSLQKLCKNWSSNWLLVWYLDPSETVFICMIPNRILRSRVSRHECRRGAKKAPLLDLRVWEFSLDVQGCFCNTCKRTVARLDSILPHRRFGLGSCGPMRDYERLYWPDVLLCNWFEWWYAVTPSLEAEPHPENFVFVIWKTPFWKKKKFEG